MLQNGSHSIHVAGDEVPAELVAEAKRFFEIHLARPIETRGHAQRFPGDVKPEFALRLFYHGEAAALHADRVADAHVRDWQAAGRNPERLQFLDAADGLDDAGKH